MALHMTTETEDIGGETLSELQRQREQLERTQRKVDEVDAHVERGNWLLKGMKSWFGLRGKAPKTPSEAMGDAAQERRSKKSAKAAAAAGAAGEEGGSGGSGGGSEEGSAAGGSGGGSARSRGSDRGASSSQTTKSRDPRHAEEDEILDQISASLVRVKAQAQDIGAEVDSHGAVLDDLAVSLGKTERKIKQATFTAKQLAK